MAQTVGDIMTREVRTCPAESPIMDAAKLMRDEGIGDVVVIKDDGQMCGLVTDRDIVVRALAEGKDASSTRLDEICTRDVVTVTPDTDAREAVRIMSDRAIRRLPVVEGDQPVGFVSIGDLAIERDPESVLADISAQPPNN